MSFSNEQTIRLSISGMHCGNCVSNVEKAFHSTEGVLSVVVSLTSNSAVVVYDTSKLSAEDIPHILDKTNFSATILVDTFDIFSDKNKKIHEKKLKVDLIKLVIAVILTIIVMVIHYIGNFNVFSNITMLILTIPVQFYCGWSFIKGAWKSVINKNPNMDLLVALGTLITFIYSVYICFVGGMPSFETSCMLISFISFGEYIENRAKGKTNKVIESLINLFPKNIDPQVGELIDIDKSSVIPADGIIVEGETLVDESMLAGESDLIRKIIGNDVCAGTKNVSESIKIKVSRSKEDSVLSKIIRAVYDAQSSKAPVSRIADKVAGVFVPIVLGIALITFIAWFVILDATISIKLKQALMCAVSILTVACPCALVLATPIALTVAMGRAAELGIIIRDGAVLELMCNIGHAVFDKTGTLTKSNLDKDALSAKSLRFDAKETVTYLQNKMHIKTYMISGDKKSEALRIANLIGINENNVIYEANPISKKEYLKKLMDESKLQNNKRDKFAYIGDGINDAPAMTTSDVGVTLESATDIALESGSVVLMHNKLKDLVVAIRLSKRTMGKIKQNIFWAICYNIVFIPLAAFGIMIPMWCGAIHAASSLFVVFNSLLLKRFKKS